MALARKGGSWAPEEAKGLSLFARIREMMLAQRALDMAMDSVVNGKPVNVPVTIAKQLPLDAAFDLIRGLPESQAGAAHETNRVGDIPLSDDDFVRLYRAQSQRAAAGLAAVKQASIAQDLGKSMRSLNGRLALGVVLINGFDFYVNLQTIRSSEDKKALRNAWFGLFDASAGVLGGMLEIGALAAASRAERLFGAAAASSLTVDALKTGTYFFGAVSGVLNAVNAAIKRLEAKEIGAVGAYRAYLASMVGFLGFAGLNAALGAGSIAKLMAARGLGGAATRIIATRLGTGAAASVLSGWGLALLAAGIIFEAVAIFLTPTPLQTWAGRSYFGNGDDKYPVGDWAAEEQGLMDALDLATDESETVSVRESDAIDYTKVTP